MQCFNYISVMNNFLSCQAASYTTDFILHGKKPWRTWRGLWIVNMYGFPFYKTPWISCTPTKVLAFGVLWSRYETSLATETWNTGWSRITNTWRYVSNVIVILLLSDRAIFSLNVIFPYLNTSQLHFTWISLLVAVAVLRKLAHKGSTRTA